VKNSQHCKYDPISQDISQQTQLSASDLPKCEQQPHSDENQSLSFDQLHDQKTTKQK
jgi:hypothetical protein